MRNFQPFPKRRRFRREAFVGVRRFFMTVETIVMFKLRGLRLAAPIDYDEPRARRPGLLTLSGRVVTARQHVERLFARHQIAAVPAEF